MFNRHARTAAASTAILLIAGVAVAQVAGTPVLDRTETEQNPAVVVTVDDNPSVDDMTERVAPAKIDDDPSAEDPAGDMSGNCDEAEHANDDRCAGTAAPIGGVTSTTIDDDGGDLTTSTTIDDHGGDDDSTTSTTIDDGGDSTTSTTIDDHGGDDDSTTSTTIDDGGDSTTSTTIDDRGGDDDSTTSTKIDDDDDAGDDDSGRDDD